MKCLVLQKRPLPSVEAELIKVNTGQSWGFISFLKCSDLGIYKTKSSIILIKYLYFRDKVKALAIYDYARIRFTY